MISNPYSRSDTLFSSTPGLYSIPRDNQYAIPSIVRSAILSASLKPVAKGRVESNQMLIYYPLGLLILGWTDYIIDREGAIHHMDQDNPYLMGQVRCYRNKYCYQK